MTMISRDPFARTELHRRTILRKTPGCDNCGQKRMRNGREIDGLFIYITEHGSGRKQEHKGAFCSLSCHNTFHG